MYLNPKSLLKLGLRTCPHSKLLRSKPRYETPAHQLAAQRKSQSAACLTAGTPGFSLCCRRPGLPRSNLPCRHANRLWSYVGVFEKVPIVINGHILKEINVTPNCFWDPVTSLPKPLGFDTSRMLTGHTPVLYSLPEKAMDVAPP